jgi:hypothetical protein
VETGASFRRGGVGGSSVNLFFFVFVLLLFFALLFIIMVITVFFPLLFLLVFLVPCVLLFVSMFFVLVAVHRNVLRAMHLRVGVRTAEFPGVLSHTHKSSQQLCNDGSSSGDLR